MINKKIRKIINENEELEGAVILDKHAYDNSIIGYTTDGRLVYSYDKMIEEYMDDENCDELEAVEWISYNTERALPCFGEKAPIIIYSFYEF